MSKILILLITEFINGFIDFAGDNILNDIVPIALHAENYLKSIGINGLMTLFRVFLDFGISLIILKFLKKGFDIYILWIDGDIDSNPVLLLTNFFKSLAIALSFPTIYTWLTEIIVDLIDKIFKATGLNEEGSLTALTESLTSFGLFISFIFLVFFILFLLLWIQFIKRGLELLILRIGLPVACTGLMDADKGVFKGYIQTLLQGTITVLVQVTLAKLSLVLMLGGHPFWGIAAVSSALKTPKFLQNVLITVGGGNGIMNTAYSTARLVQMIKRIV